MNRTAVILFSIAIYILLSACDPSSSVTYIVKNLSDSVVMVVLKADVGYRILQADIQDNWKTSKENDSVLLQANEFMENAYEWLHSSPQSHRPLWDAIKSIRLGTAEYPQNLWYLESKWIMKSESSGSFDLDHSEYTLEINNIEQKD